MSATATSVAPPMVSLPLEKLFTMLSQKKHPSVKERLRYPSQILKEPRSQLRKFAHATQLPSPEQDPPSRPTPINSVEESTSLKPYSKLLQQTTPFRALDRVLKKESRSLTMSPTKVNNQVVSAQPYAIDYFTQAMITQSLTLYFHNNFAISLIHISLEFIYIFNISSLKVTYNAIMINLRDLKLNRFLIIFKFNIFQTLLF
jgi:hypothetical protein